MPTVFFVTMGTTSTLAIDDVKTIGSVCREFGVWLHIDAAFLGAFAMLPEFQPRGETPLFKGAELCNSININGHKSLGMGVSVSFLWTSYSRLEYARFVCFGTEDQARLEGKAEKSGGFWDLGCLSPCSLFRSPPAQPEVHPSDLYLFGSIGSHFVRSFVFLKTVGIDKVQQALRADILKA